jgi:hypothetical protein
MVSHGVDKIFEGTCPPDLVASDPSILERRVCLQFRQVPLQVRNSWSQMEGGEEKTG